MYNEYAVGLWLGYLSWWLLTFVSEQLDDVVEGPVETVPLLGRTVLTVVAHALCCVVHGTTQAENN